MQTVGLILMPLCQEFREDSASGGVDAAEKEDTLTDVQEIRYNTLETAITEGK